MRAKWFTLHWACQDDADFCAFVKAADEQDALVAGLPLSPPGPYLVAAHPLEVPLPAPKWLHRRLSSDDIEELDVEHTLEQQFYGANPFREGG